MQIKIVSSIQERTLAPTSKVADALAVLERNKGRAALVCDAKSGALLGTITDGDVRRHLIAGGGFDGKSQDIMSRNPRTLPMKTPKAEISTLMGRTLLRCIPLVDSRGVPQAVAEVVLEESSGADRVAVVLAGGEGLRLRPLTQDLPKPMLQVGGKPVLETIVGQLRDAGVRKVYLAINYLGEVIEKHFKDGSAFGVQIEYLREDTKLGTAGALSLLSELPPGPFLVMNGDVITKVDFASLFRSHVDHRAAVTVAATRYSVEIPFGVMDVSRNFLTGIREKPVEKYFCNAGIYVIDPGVVGLLDEAVKTDMTTLLSKVMERGWPVSVFPLHEYWVDIGNPQDLNRVQAEIEGAAK